MNPWLELAGPVCSEGRLTCFCYSEEMNCYLLQMHILTGAQQSGNPLHCSCRENPRDGGAWWAAVYGVT